MLSLDEVKLYLKVDQDDEDDIITGFILSAERMVADILRSDTDTLVENQPITKIAVLYATAYLYEHREDADYHNLMLSLRAMLFGVREVQF
nr:MAG TPA: head tail connector [Bacteriophage sp.]